MQANWNPPYLITAIKQVKPLTTSPTLTPFLQWPCDPNSPLTFPVMTTAPGRWEGNLTHICYVDDINQTHAFGWCGPTDRCSQVAHYDRLRHQLVDFSPIEVLVVFRLGWSFQYSSRRLGRFGFGLFSIFSLSATGGSLSQIITFLIILMNKDCKSFDYLDLSSIHLSYSFVAVFIVADIFMCSIDAITSKTKV